MEGLKRGMSLSRPGNREFRCMYVRQGSCYGFGSHVSRAS